VHSFSFSLLKILFSEIFFGATSGTPKKVCANKKALLMRRAKNKRLKKYLAPERIGYRSRRKIRYAPNSMPHLTELEA